MVPFAQSGTDLVGEIVARQGDSPREVSCLWHPALTYNINIDRMQTSGLAASPPQSSISASFFVGKGVPSSYRYIARVSVGKSRGLGR